MLNQKTDLELVRAMFDKQDVGYRFRDGYSHSVITLGTAVDAVVELSFLKTGEFDCTSSRPAVNMDPHCICSKAWGEHEHGCPSGC